MKLIDTRSAVGHVLCHDMTQIIPGVYKGARFRKGHIVTEEDIPVLLSMGKEHLYVWEKNPGMLHEDEAAERLRALCQNEHMDATEVKEGKIELLAGCDGLFQVDVDRLNALNGVDELMIATRHTNTAVRKGDKLAGMRVIPLVIQEERLREAEALAGERPILSLTPWKLKTCGLITTGGEVAQGLVQDAFTPVIEEKLSAYGITVTERCLPGDDRGAITAAALDYHARGVDLVLCTGGMSVDPDDRTPGRHPGHRSGDRLLRGSGAAGGHAPAGLLCRRRPHPGAPRLRHVQQGHRLRPAAPPHLRRRADHPAGAQGPGPRRPLPGLPGVPLPHLPLRKGD